MCNPLLAGAAITAIAAGAQAYQQADAQREQVNYQDRVARATEKSASMAADSDYAAVSERIIQTRQAAAQEAFEVAREADQADASLTVGAQAAGLAGGVVGDLRKTLAIQTADNVALHQRNASWEEQQIMRSLISIQSQHQSRLNSAMPTPVAGIDYGQLLGTLGSSAVQANQGYLQHKGG